LAGGVALHLLTALQEPRFMQAYFRNGRFEAMMKRLPVRVSTTGALLVEVATYNLEILSDHKE
jgi:glucokinase